MDVDEVREIRQGALFLLRHSKKLGSREKTPGNEGMDNKADSYFLENAQVLFLARKSKMTKSQPADER